jgi:aminoglycoside phosphotransferase (APT) family kinase protein
VIRYHVRVEVPGAAPGERELVFFAKVHSDLSDAAVAHHVAEDLWHARAPLPGAVRRFIPRPLALVQELNLVLSEAAGGAEHREWVSGAAVLRPPGRRGTAGGAAHCANAHTRDALVASATALASWHTSEVSGWLAQQRCAERYTAKVMHWTRVLIGQTPALGGELASAASYLAQTLSAVSVECAVPVHGAFKPSQLVFNGAGQPVVTDFDGACLGDPALDVGCFLAYLRPVGLRSGKRLSVTPAGLPRDEGDSSSGSVQWLASARLTFLDAYFRTLLGYGASASRVQAIGQRANLFEAALMFKIASRRARRLNSPQPTELKAVLSEIEECLLRFDGAKEASK